MPVDDTLMTDCGQARKLVAELVARNSIGEQFTDDVPPDWPLEAWELLLDAKSNNFDTESLHFWLAGHVYMPYEIVRTLGKSPLYRFTASAS